MWTTTTIRVWCQIPILLLVTTHIDGQIKNTIDNSFFPLNITSDALPNLKAEAMLNDVLRQMDNSNSIQSSEITSDYMTSTNQYTTDVETSTERATTETMTTTFTAQTCAVVESKNFVVVKRTSTEFIALITYNCTLISSPQLEYNIPSAVCTISNNTATSTVNVTCESIENKAGRNVSFSLVGNQSDQIIVDRTFIVTLLPLSLLNSTNISVLVHENLTASFDIFNCKSIVQPEYLVFRCDNSSTSVDHSLTENCTYTCSDLQPGNNYTASLVRLNVTLTDFSNGSIDISEEECLYVSYSTALDSVRNLEFTGNLSENGTAIIYFIGPRGSYDKIYLNCSAEDQLCSDAIENLRSDTSNCSSCTSISIAKIVQGVQYHCTATTTKNNFQDVTSDRYSFRTPLKPVTFISSQFLNKSEINVNVFYHSDYHHVQSTCLMDRNQEYPCVNYTMFNEINSTTSNKNCLTNVTLKGVLGCNYQCFFTTIKANQTDEPSDRINWTLFPPTPLIIFHEKGSRWIFLRWNIAEIAYIKSFDVFTNSSRENSSKPNVSLDKKTFSYNYTIGLLPFRSYDLYIQLNSNFVTISSNLSFQTDEEAPKEPDQNDIDEKLNPLDDDPGSKSTQYVLDINRTLFSNEYGILKEYLIYVRQDQTNNDTAEINLNQTYYDAWYNASLDYWALVESVNISTRSVLNEESGSIKITLGDQSGCLDEPLQSEPCNGPLRPSTTYKVIVMGCTNAGCTPALSRAFTTQNAPSKNKRPIGWVAVFPFLALLAIVAVLVTWKRKEIKQMIDQKREKAEEPSTPTPVIYSVPAKRPKALSRYVNMTKEEEKSIRNEYQELDKDAPQYSQLDSDPQYSVYNRYGNIPARGSWNDTAVRLDATHRTHDYINANEIQGFYSKKQYLAAQGPLEGTCEDFWDMVIQYRVLKVVMLTRTEERDPHNPSQTLCKCHRYFPRNRGDSLEFGDINVQVLDVDTQLDGELEIRHILIRDKETKHRIFHYYFTGWPDFSVVDQKKLLDLIETVNNHQRDVSSVTKTSKNGLLTPMVIHCSAGVGRTGTYIAVDIIIRLINQSKDSLSTMELDVMGIVFQLRENRVKMVQTRDQYMLVNHCVEEYLRRINRLSDICRKTSIYENSQSISSSHRGGKTNRKRPVGPSAVYINERKSTSSADQSDGSSVVLRSYKTENEQKPRRSTYRKPSQKS